MATPKSLNFANPKLVKIGIGQAAGQDTFRFDLQLLLERGTLNETWNKLMRSGVLGDMMNSPTISNINLISPSGTFPCACCEGECDTKCPTVPQSPSDPLHPNTVARLIHSWTWSKDLGESTPVEKEINSWLINIVRHEFRQFIELGQKR